MAGRKIGTGPGGGPREPHKNSRKARSRIFVGPAWAERQRERKELHRQLAERLEGVEEIINKLSGLRDDFATFKERVDHWQRRVETGY